MTLLEGGKHKATGSRIETARHLDVRQCAHYFILDSEYYTRLYLLPLPLPPPFESSDPRFIVTISSRPLTSCLLLDAYRQSHVQQALMDK
jgi:hypothetical protein